MKRLNRIWKYYFAGTFVFVVVLTLTGFLLGSQLRNRLNAQLKEDVLLLAKVIARTIPDTPRSDVLVAFCREYKELTGIRITLIERGGRVQSDSDMSPPPTDDHANRPEVQAAIREGAGTSIRYSGTLNMDMLYVALDVKERGLILRLSMPMTQVRRAENQVMAIFTLTLFLLPAFAAGIYFLLVRRLSRGPERFS
ncbi:MAG: hypothetical protein JW821_15965 [Deltaproteobacteria bacterium]|nr:hypothetical protein [Deltaproteobacteria bacterium]